jgi:hypothetical protein
MKEGASISSIHQFRFCINLGFLKGWGDYWGLPKTYEEGVKKRMNRQCGTHATCT